MIIAGEKSANPVIIMPRLEEIYTVLKAMEKNITGPILNF